MRRIDELFEIERMINGKTPEQRVAVRQEKSKPLVLALEAWLREQRAKLSSKNETAKAINYCLTRWTAFTRFMGEFASVTTQLKEPCAAWLSAEKIGPSQGRMPEGTGPQLFLR